MEFKGHSDDPADVPQFYTHYLGKDGHPYRHERIGLLKIQIGSLRPE